MHFVLLALPFVPGHPPEKESVALASCRDGWLRSRDRVFCLGPKQGEQEQGKDTSASSPADSPVLPEDRSRMQAPGTPVCARAARSAVPCLPARGGQLLYWLIYLQGMRVALFRAATTARTYWEDRGKPRWGGQMPEPGAGGEPPPGPPR